MHIFIRLFVTTVVTALGEPFALSVSSSGCNGSYTMRSDADVKSSLSGLTPRTPSPRSTKGSSGRSSGRMESLPRTLPSCAASFGAAFS
eukprot:2619544-Rhodomonas_salina.1